MRIPLLYNIYEIIPSPLYQNNQDVRGTIYITLFIIFNIFIGIKFVCSAKGKLLLDIKTTEITK